MDIIKFDNLIHPARMTDAKIINGIKSKMWVERYRDAGEFTFTCPLDSGVRELLPRGSFVSHVDSEEIMVVENHSISETRGNPVDVVISGRSYETFLENRIVGSNVNSPAPLAGANHAYGIGAAPTWDQALFLVQHHTYSTYLLDIYNQIPYVTVMNDIYPGTTGDSEPRFIDRGDLYTRLIELLTIDNLGIRTIRPGPYSILGPSDPKTAFVIHNGTDRRYETTFTYAKGEVESSDYLWSNKKYKTTVMLGSKWFVVFVGFAAQNENRRMTYVDVSFLDNDFNEVPTGSDLVNITNAMNQIGVDTLKHTKETVITKVEIAKDNVRARYRYDYGLGDKITVSGGYDETASMMVTEYVEIEDENGSVGYPTLSTF